MTDIRSNIVRGFDETNCILCTILSALHVKRRFIHPNRLIRIWAQMRRGIEKILLYVPEVFTAHGAYFLERPV